MNPITEIARMSARVSGGRLRSWSFRAAIPGLMILSLVAFAGLPQPMCIYYGQARNAYGEPYTKDAEVILYRGTNVVARHTITGDLSPGVNFALYAHLDDGRSAKNYSPRAVHAGDLVSVVVSDGQGQKTIMENQAVPQVGQPGDQILINATAGDDTDGDGLPDQWEYELIAGSDGWLNSLADVRGSDDFDGDGQSNLAEYRAGTYAFLNYDFFYAEQFTLTPNGRFQVTFWGVPGKVYRAQCTANPTREVWIPCPLALSDTADFQAPPAVGTGNWLSLYLPLTPGARFFRLVVE